MLVLEEEILDDAALCVENEDIVGCDDEWWRCTTGLLYTLSFSVPKEKISKKVKHKKQIIKKENLQTRFSKKKKNSTTN